MEESFGLPTDSSLPVPMSLFVFSFYELPDPEIFFRELNRSGIRIPLPSFPGLGRRSGKIPKEGRRCLLVLDGLEKVQEVGTLGSAFGQISHWGLRQFLLEIAEGYSPGTSVVITSRFVFEDLLYAQGPCFRAVPVERLGLAACVGLLKQRGVHGATFQLEQIAQECGCHALTVDLVAGYVAHFGKGDPETRLGLPSAAELEEAVRQRSSREGRYVVEQSLRFERVAQRYREALDQTDPATPALLQRVCLFRTKIDAKRLTRIFTGPGKEGISGPALAKLSYTDVEQRLSFLVDMRLLETAGEDQSYVVHPAVQDGFLRQLSAETVRQGHQAVHDALLGALPGPYSNPADPASLALFEEVIHHALQAGLSEEAWDIYWNRIGAYGNLGWRLGDYMRGESICRAFLAGQPPGLVSSPRELSKESQVLLLKEHALYLEGLGQLARAVELCSEHNRHWREPDWRSASAGHQVLAGFHLLRGRLSDGLNAARQAVDFAAGDCGERYGSLALLAYAKMLQGNTESAMEDFAEAEKLFGPPRRIDALPGLWRALLSARLARYEEARALTRENLEVCRSHLGKENSVAPKCKLLLADLACALQNFTAARRLLACVDRWTFKRAAQEPLCWAALVRARILVGEARAGLAEPSSSLCEALGVIEKGIALSRDCGYGLYHIDLLVLRAEVFLLLDEVEKAERSTRAALFGLAPPLPAAGDYGFSPREERAPSKLRLISPRVGSGLPELLAATHDDCGYTWGEGDARFVLAEALLSRAAKLYGQLQFDPAQRASLGTQIQGLIEDATKQLQTCLELRRRIQDPKAAVTQVRLEQLQAGILKTAVPTETPMVDKEPAMMKNMPPEERPRVFVSHSSEDKRFVQRLVEDLKSRGLPVWLDEVELEAGNSIIEKISKGLRDTDYLVIVLSQASVQSLWVRAELNAALMRQFSGKGTIVLPAIIEDCEIPALLQDRKYADFRRSYEEGLQTLLSVLEHEAVSASDLETSLA
jgi:tetratricopeptide (TPR) repeat protein